jgi:hypothetical protein
MLHQIGIMVLSKQVDLVTIPSNKFHQITHKVQYLQENACYKGMDMLDEIKHNS